MYALIGFSFVIVTLLLDLVILRTRVTGRHSFWIVLGIMTGFTLVFDQLLTGLPIVEYNDALTSGLRIWHAPIEDFLYTIAAVIGIGALVSHESKP